jgi:hypothetical protein
MCRTPDTYTLARFVRARKGDVALAVEQYVNMKKWRRTERVDGTGYQYQWR